MPDLIITDDPMPDRIPPKKEPHMLFKFTTTKPPAIEIWNTLSNYDFKPDQGYTTDQIRFICYCLFQLKDFKEVKDIVNNYITRHHTLNVLEYELKSFININLLKSLQLPPADFPHFVDESLYIPYYMLMQLNVGVQSNLWGYLFDRDLLRTPEEIGYIIANQHQQSITKSITEYKIWLNEPSLDSIFSIFKIDESLSPVEINTIHGIRSALQKYIHDYLEGTPIYDYSSPIIIPPFKLRSTDVPQ